jgi:DNA end-binding protein Ku
MAARAIASGTIAFGLVSIPVKLYSAAHSQDVHFHLLHDADGGRLRQSYGCRSCGATVERDHMVRGYEYAREQFVVLSAEELKALESRSDQSIAIEEFVPIAKVDPLYFEHGNLLGPDKGGSKAYHLLREAMIESERVAIGRYQARGRQPLVLLRPTAEGLVMHTLFYADEVRSFADVDLGERAPVRDAELALAKQLIDQLSQKSFDAGKYEDTYRRGVLGVIERKVAGEQVIAAPAAEPREKIIDLVAALKQSLSEREAMAGKAETRKSARKVSSKGTPKRKSEAQ